MADFSMSDMPWLGQPADPAGSLARGIQAGSMLANTRMQRESLAMRRMQFEAEQQERAAMLPLELTLKQQDSELKALNIEGVLEARQDRIANESDLLNLNKLVARSFSEADGPETAQQMLFESLTKNPRLINDPRFVELRKMVDTSLAAKLQLAEVRAASRGSDYTPGFETIINPQTGKPHVVFRSGAGSAQLMDDATAPKPQSTLGKMFADRDAAIAAGRVDEARAIDKKIELDQAAASTYAGLTPANQTRVQQGLSDSLTTIDVANRLEPLIDTETVGARSFVETWVKDRVLAQAFPEMASNKRASAESLAAQLRASAVRELKTDSNITEKERNQILQSIPDINAPIDSPARAKQLISDIRKMSAVRAVVSAVKLGQPMPKPAAQVLSDDELVRLVNTGVITDKQALEIFDARQ